MLLKFICDDLVHVNTPVTAVKMIEKGERFGEHEDEIECGWDDDDDDMAG